MKRDEAPGTRHCPDCSASSSEIAMWHDETCPLANAARDAEESDRAWLEAHPGKALRRQVTREEHDLYRVDGIDGIVVVRVRLSRDGRTMRYHLFDAKGRAVATSLAGDGRDE